MSEKEQVLQMLNAAEDDDENVYYDAEEQKTRNCRSVKKGVVEG
jgi:hypothetical protein